MPTFIPLALKVPLPSQLPALLVQFLSLNSLLPTLFHLPRGGSDKKVLKLQECGL